MTYPDVEVMVDSLGDVYPWESDLNLALEDLSYKSLDIDRHWRYYEGDHPPVWLTDKIQRMFRNMAHQMGENWCEVAIDSLLRRLEVIGWKLRDRKDTDKLPKEDSAAQAAVEAAKLLFRDSDLELDQSDLYRHMFLGGEGFLIAYRGDPDSDQEDDGPTIGVQDPRNIWWPPDCHRTNPPVVAQVWGDVAEGVWRATLYYPLDTVRLVGPVYKGIHSRPDTAKDFKLDPENPGGPHGFDRVPVIRFAMYKKRKPRLRPVLPVQDKINKLSANKMVAAEFGAFRQRWFITNQEFDDGDVEARPDRAIHLTAGDEGEGRVRVGEFSATELDNYDNSISKEIHKFFTLMSLPKHMMVNPGTDPSGAAQEADEGPFLELILDAQRAISASHADTMMLFGLNVQPEWRTPRVRGEAESVLNIRVATEAEIPLIPAMRKYGNWTDEELLEIEKQIEENRKLAEEIAKAAPADNPNTPNDGPPEPPKPPSAPVRGG